MTLSFPNITPRRLEKFPYRAKQLLWIEALESGKYAQGKGFLKLDAPGKALYCCLGVYCELEGISQRLGSQATAQGSRCYLFGTGGAEESGTLPLSLVRELGLFDQFGTFDQVVHLRDRPRSSLVDCNDEEPPLSFAEIAQYIRYDPWNVFKHEDSDSGKLQAA